MLINKELLDKVAAEAKANPRLRMNYNFHDSADSPSQRLLNALEIGTLLPVHRHTYTGETYILLQGRIDVLFCDEKGAVKELFHLDPKIGHFGVNIPQGQWHTLEVLESGSVIFEVKDGPYAPLKPEDILSE